jgi:hypothetical protein
MRSNKAGSGALPGGSGEPVDGPSAIALAKRRSESRTRRAAWTIAGFLILFTPINLYWALGGKWGLAWVGGGCDDCIPVSVIWAQQVAMFCGIVIVLGRAGIWRTPLPRWILWAGAWGMAAAFFGVALQNLIGDNRPEATWLFAPVAALVSVLCVIVALTRADGVRNGPGSGRDHR